MNKIIFLTTVVIAVTPGINKLIGEKFISERDRSTVLCESIIGNRVDTVPLKAVKKTTNTQVPVTGNTYTIPGSTYNSNRVTAPGNVTNGANIFTPRPKHAISGFNRNNSNRAIPGATLNGNGIATPGANTANTNSSLTSSGVLPVPGTMSNPTGTGISGTSGSGTSGGAPGTSGNSSSILGSNTGNIQLNTTPTMGTVAGATGSMTAGNGRIATPDSTRMNLDINATRQQSIRNRVDTITPVKSTTRNSADTSKQY